MVKADIFAAESLKDHFKDQDVVMSCLGFPASFFSGVTGYTMSMAAVVSAMREARVSRLIAMTSWYTERKWRLCSQLSSLSFWRPFFPPEEIQVFGETEPEKENTKYFTFVTIIFLNALKNESGE